MNEPIEGIAATICKQHSHMIRRIQMRTTQLSKLYKTGALAAITSAAIVSGQAFAQSAVLTDKAGMTVYTWDKDAAGKSACYGGCAKTWPPVAAANMPPGPDFSVIARDDETPQQAGYKGKPLYLFSGDKRPGDTTGDNRQNVWHVISRSGVSSGSRAPSTSYRPDPSYPR
jgi:predicted lipoprotein with Yx(FWY)xxD motif